MTRELFTKNGDRVLISDEDYDQLSIFNWRIDSNGYVRRSEGRGGCAFIHRQIAGLVRGDGLKVDHISGDKLDNRRENLRVCSNAENMRNRGAQSNSKSGVKGVCWNKQCGKWQAQIRTDGKLVYLGLFQNIDDAHAAYCIAADKMHGDFSNYGEVKL